MMSYNSYLDNVQGRFLMNPISSFFVALIVATITYQIGTHIYNIFFHPLRKFPGPKICAASRLPVAYHMLKGTVHTWDLDLHLKYGPVVRYAPDMLSFTDERAWKEIHSNKRPYPAKDPESYGIPPNKVPGLLSCHNEENHARMRKVFAHAFSDKACVTSRLKEQEPLFQQYIDMLIANIERMSKTDPEAPIDMVNQLNFTTFDIMGDLTFGEPLGLLEKSEFTPWAGMIFKVLRAGTVIRVLKMFPLSLYILNRWMPRPLRRISDEHFKYATDRVDKRLEANIERPDIWGLVLRQQEEGRGLSVKEMHSNAALFMGAGTETTATELSGLLYYLLTNPEKMIRLVSEIRTSFQSDEDMHMESIAQLKYLHACLEESLRMYPPVPIGLPRIVPSQGATICGEHIPGGVNVSITQYATYRSPSNFTSPNNYIPERWLSDEKSIYASDKKAALQPFSNGPRNCIGKNMAYHEMRFVITKLLWRFDFELCEESENWAETQRVFGLWEKRPLLVRARNVRG